MSENELIAKLDAIGLLLERRGKGDAAEEAHKTLWGKIDAMAGKIDAVITAQAQGTTDRALLRASIDRVDENLNRHVEWEMEERRRSEASMAALVNSMQTRITGVDSRVHSLEQAHDRLIGATGMIGWIGRHWPALAAITAAIGLWWQGGGAK